MNVRYVNGKVMKMNFKNFPDFCGTTQVMNYVPYVGLETTFIQV